MLLGSFLLAVILIMRSTLVLAALIELVVSQKDFPAKGDGSFAGGIFCIPLTQLATMVTSPKTGNLFGIAKGSESPQNAKSTQTTPGSGPYPARFLQDASLPQHTVYAPKEPPKGVKLPVIAWGNGACGMDGSGFANFLLEIASHGFLVIADGAPQSSNDGGKDIFVHISILGPAGLSHLAEGQPVNMRVVDTPKGREALSISLG